MMFKALIYDAEAFYSLFGGIDSSSVYSTWIVGERWGHVSESRWLCGSMAALSERGET